MQILVAEDEPTTAVFLRGMLSRMGHRVTLARDGLGAWELLQTSSFNVVITDWMMPGLDGLELCRRIRAHVEPSYTYIILLTARDGAEDRLTGLDSGADDLLTKRPDYAELTARLKIAERILGMQDELQEKNARLEALAATDPLTGLANRRVLDDAIDKAFARSLRGESALSIVLVDVDHFKNYNDAFGHPAGDQVLRSVANLVRLNSREYDLVGRFGGEEFLAILNGSTDANAVAFAERLRRSIERHAWQLRQVTASFGIATATASVESPTKLLESADRALYHSKRLGRNRVTHFQELSPQVLIRSRRADAALSRSPCAPALVPQSASLQAEDDAIKTA
jgi:two-component system chemotaxis response regulator CheY